MSIVKLGPMVKKLIFPSSKAKMSFFTIRGSFETPIFAQLQDDPEGIRLPSYVAVQDLPPVVLFTLCHTTSDGCVLI
jgi:hypothetical protein